MQNMSELGRSMIEMLGVLAIIGVLSVGGIAGYSKAMDKYKINNVIHEYSELSSGYLRNKSSFQSSRSASAEALVKAYEALDLIPRTWVKENATTYLDSAGNIINFNYNGFGVDFSLQGSNIYKYCLAMFSDFIIPLNSQLGEVGLYTPNLNSYGEYKEGEGGWIDSYFGANYKGESSGEYVVTHQLKDINMAKVAQFCNRNNLSSIIAGFHIAF